MKKDFLIFIILLLLLVSCTQKPNTPGDTGPGHLGTWITTSSTTAFSRSDPIAYNDRMYFIGELTNVPFHHGDMFSSNYTSNIYPVNAIPLTQTSLENPALLTIVQSALINSDGSTGRWISSTSLPFTGTVTTGTTICTTPAYPASPTSYYSYIEPVSLMTSNGFIYAFFTQSVLFTKINPDGSLNPWEPAKPIPYSISVTTITNILAQIGSSITSVSQFCSYYYMPTITEYNGYVYAMFTQTVWATQINSDGSLKSWQQSMPLTSPVIGMTGFAYNNYLYIIGENPYTYGLSTHNYEIYRASIYFDGSLGNWVFLGNWLYGNSLVVLYNSWIYLLGDSLHTNTVTRIPINNNGSFGQGLKETSMLFGWPFVGIGYNNFLYAFGGFPVTQTSGGVYTTQGSFTTTVEYTKIYP